MSGVDDLELLFEELLEESLELSELLVEVSLGALESLFFEEPLLPEP